MRSRNMAKEGGKLENRGGIGMRSGKMGEGGGTIRK